MIRTFNTNCQHQLIAVSLLYVVAAADGDDVMAIIVLILV
jgi:hypothetical protein